MADLVDPIDQLHVELLELRAEILAAIDHLREEVAWWEPLPAPRRREPLHVQRTKKGT